VALDPIRCAAIEPGNHDSARCPDARRFPGFVDAARFTIG
jgi:hypothetical protein